MAHMAMTVAKNARSRTYRCALTSAVNVGQWKYGILLSQ
jgi:hypothetical protein